MDDLGISYSNLGNLNEAEIYAVADVHIGDGYTNIQDIRHFISYILDKKNRFVVLNGDLMNMGLAISVTNVYDEEYTPSEQIKKTADIFRPLVDHGRVLSIGTGNHEDRVYKVTGIDIGYYLAKDLGIEDRYHQNSFVQIIELNGIKYSMFVWHGAGGGRKKGGKINRLVDMNQTVDTDMYVMGHVHDPMITPTKKFSIDLKNNRLIVNNQYYMITNAWQDFGGYGQKFGFSPASKEVTYFVINGKEKNIKVRLGI